MRLYNYNVSNGLLYENIYDFNCMSLGFFLISENENIIQQYVFYNVTNLYVDDFFNNSINSEEGLYFIQVMSNLQTIKFGYPLDETDENKGKIWIII